MVVMVSNIISVLFLDGLLSNLNPFSLSLNEQLMTMEEFNEAVCRSHVDISTFRLEIARHNDRLPPGLSFSNSYLSLNAVTKQDNGLEFIFTLGDILDTLTLRLLFNSSR